MFLSCFLNMRDKIKHLINCLHNNINFEPIIIDNDKDKFEAEMLLIRYQIEGYWNKDTYFLANYLYDICDIKGKSLLIYKS